MVTKQRGSAIIVAVLLISAIGAVGFSFGRVFLSEFANATVHENGVFAYYSAESGIEEGFLRYRYSRDAEVPFANWKMETPTDRNKFNLANVTAPNSLGSRNKTANNSLSFANQYYYLRMGYAGIGALPFFGQDVAAPLNGKLDALDIKEASYGTGDYSYLKIVQDDSYKIDLTNLLRANFSYDINLFAKFLGRSSIDTANIGNSFIEAKLIIDTIGNGSAVKEYKTILSANPDTTCLDLQTVENRATCAASAVKTSSITVSGNDYAWGITNLISYWRTQATPNMFVPSNISKVTLVLKPLYHDAVVGITSNVCSPSGLPGFACDYTANTVVPGPFTTVSSVGTYKGVYRTLEANIDRQSGSLYDLYDYVIYKAK